MPRQNHLYQWISTQDCRQRILGVLESLPSPRWAQRQYGFAIPSGCRRQNTRDFIPRRSAPRLSPSEASSVIPNNPLYNAPGGEGQPQGNACPDFSKTRHRKPFLGVCRRSAEKRDLRIAFSGIYAIFIEGTFRCFLRVKGIFAPSCGRHLHHCRFSS